MEEYPNPLVNQNVSLAYATLIGRFQFGNTDSVNQELLQLVLDRETTSSSVDYANQGGWHSTADFLEWPSTAVTTLRGFVSEGLNRMVQATGQLPEVAGRSAPPRGGFKLSAWANVSRRGNYHRMHNHPHNAWSGVYYVTTTSTANSLAGVLEFYDPRPFTEMIDVPGNPYGQRMIVRPQPGLMVMFPSWLYHFVHPSDSDSPRVSIAFNAAWHPT